MLLDELTGHFAPQDLPEHRYVREMADAEWRLRRVRDYIKYSIAFRADCLNQHNPEADPTFHQALAFEDAHRDAGLGLYLRYETQFQRQYDRAFQGLLKYRDQAARRPKPQPVSVLPFEPISTSAPAEPALVTERTQTNPQAPVPVAPKKGFAIAGDLTYTSHP
jgi:hypothetical protein